MQLMTAFCQLTKGPLPLPSVSGQLPSVTLQPLSSSPNLSLASSAQPTIISRESLSEQADLLRTCGMDIQALNTANGLRNVIEQVESGQVKRIRDLYGPKSGKNTATDTTGVSWNKIKGTITKRERIYDQLVKQFGGDKDRFFDFFTIQGTSRKRKNRNGNGELQALRKVADAIPHCMGDVTREKEMAIYLNSSGQFSNELWAQKWAGKNDWEVWRELGKEQY
jgi:hypothetical protein